MSKKFAHDTDFDNNKVVSHDKNIPLQVVGADQVDAAGVIIPVAKFNGAEVRVRGPILAIGMSAGEKFTATAGGTVFIGTRAGQNFIDPFLTIGIGVNALQQASGHGATAVGASSGYDNTGDDVALYGKQSGMRNKASGVVAIGPNAASDNRGVGLLSIGMLAGGANTGTGVVSIGALAGAHNSGDRVVALGNGAQIGALNTAAAKTFQSTDINIGTGQVTVTGHGLVPVFTSGRASADLLLARLTSVAGQALPAGLVEYGVWKVIDPNILEPLNKPTGQGSGSYTITPLQAVPLNDVIAIGADVVVTEPQTVQIGSASKPFQLGIGNSTYGTPGQVLTVNGAGDGVEWVAGGGAAPQVYISQQGGATPGTPANPGTPLLGGPIPAAPIEGSVFFNPVTGNWWQYGPSTAPGAAVGTLAWNPMPSGHGVTTATTTKQVPANPGNGETLFAWPAGHAPRVGDVFRNDPDGKRWIYGPDPANPGQNTWLPDCCGGSFVEDLPAVTHDVALTVTHNLNTMDVSISLLRKATAAAGPAAGKVVDADWEIVDANSVKVTFSNDAVANLYRVIVRAA